MALDAVIIVSSSALTLGAEQGQNTSMRAPLLYKIRNSSYKNISPNIQRQFKCILRAFSTFTRHILQLPFKSYSQGEPILFRKCKVSGYYLTLSLKNCQLRNLFQSFLSYFLKTFLFSLAYNFKRFLELFSEYSEIQNYNDRLSHLRKFFFISAQNITFQIIIRTLYRTNSELPIKNR